MAKKLSSGPKILPIRLSADELAAVTARAAAAGVARATYARACLVHCRPTPEQVVASVRRDGLGSAAVEPRAKARSLRAAAKGRRAAQRARKAEK